MRALAGAFFLCIDKEKNVWYIVFSKYERTKKHVTVD